MVVPIEKSVQSQDHFAMPCFGGVREARCDIAGVHQYGQSRGVADRQLVTVARAGHGLGTNADIEFLKVTFHIPLQGPIADAGRLENSST